MGVSYLDVRKEWPIFYWQHPEPVRAAERRLASSDEGFLANDLIRGARMLAVRVPYESCPADVELPASDTAPEVYTDAIANILLVAEFMGFAIDDMLVQAVRAAENSLEWSGSAAVSRMRHPGRSASEQAGPQSTR